MYQDTTPFGTSSFEVSCKNTECEESLHIHINYFVIAHVRSYDTYTGTCTLSNADVHKEFHKAPKYEGIAPHILNLGGRW
jgi:hypothetical protein